MKANQQTIQQIERALRKVIAKFPASAEPIMTDIHLLANPDSGELRTYNDDDEELDRCVVEEWIKNTNENFYEEVAPILRDCILHIKESILKMSLLQPFSFTLIDDDHETIQDLVIIDKEETLLLDGNLLDGLEEDLDSFLEHLLKD